MRRFLILGAALCMILMGCAPGSSRPLLWYQDILTEAVLIEGDTRWRICVIPGGYTAEILSPSSAAGVVFTVTDTTAEVSLNSVRIPVSEAMLGGCRRLLSLFSLQKDWLIGVDSPGDDPDGITCAHFRTDTAKYTVGFRVDGVPAYFDITTDDTSTRYLVSEIQWKEE